MNQIIGQKFGRLTVQRDAGKRSGRRAVQCVCDCGGSSVVTITNLKTGSVKSCGCLAREITSQRSTTHGGRETRLYSIWRGMRRRCHDPSVEAYERYGGRGIAVCAAWRSDFASFREWAIGSGYAEHLTLDRINNDGDYSPDNCRWATAQQQSLNKKTNLLMDDGRSALVVSRENGISRHTFYGRIYYGWSVDNAATVPPDTLNNRKGYGNGGWKRPPSVQKRLAAKANGVLD